ncbi:MAG: hypothetical protein CUN56_00190 [Phototrophicales bacterium]|nr:MAG: hypothetical protein CUN56_00190 [Phototrophicales bacterium]
MKTANAVSPRRPKVEIVITSAIKTALPSMFPTTVPPETIDLSLIFKGNSGGGLTRTINREYVAGDDAPILDYDTRIEVGENTLTFLYTNGKETVGTDNVDPYDLFFNLIKYTAADLPLQVIVSPAGGNVGDQEFISDPNQTFIRSVSEPTVSVDASGKVQFTVTYWTSDVTTATVA